jgi:hypothetical protein
MFISARYLVINCLSIKVRKPTAHSAKGWVYAESCMPTSENTSFYEVR